MELNQFRNVDVVLDKANDNIIQKQFVSAGDKDGRSLTVQLTDNGVIGEIIGAALNLYWHNQASGLTDLSAFFVVDRATSVFKIDYPQNMLTPGKVIAYIQILHGGKVTHTKPFEITVQKLAGTTRGVLATAEYGALVTTLAKANEFETEIAQRFAHNEKKKADIVYVDNSISSLTNGGIKGTFATLSALKSAYPTNPNIGPFLVLSDKNRYVWDINKADWESIGAYDPVEISPNAITATEINSSSNSVNRFDKTKAVIGKFYSRGVGNLATEFPSAVWVGLLEPIPVDEGSIVRFNKAYLDGYYVGVDSDNIIRQIGNNIPVAGYAEVVVANGVVGFYATSHIDQINSFMLTINNPMPQIYVPSTLKKQLDWLIPTNGSVTLDSLSKPVLDKLISPLNNSYTGADGVIAGDSIVWNTGQIVNGETLIGYDGVLKRDLQLNSLLNIGVSGRPMANGTANGEGTHTTVISAGINWLSKMFFICNSGTNDFKLNVPIGVLMPFGSSFDTKTYVGAYQAMIEYLLTQTPNLIIFVMTPAQRNNGGYTTESTNTAGHKLIDYADAAKQISEKYSAVLVDIYRESGITQFVINQDTYDGLHFNNSGYEKAGKLVVKKMIYS